jgi:cell division transport system ATP-binding protein
MIALNAVTKFYAGHTRMPPVLDQLSLELRKGDFLYVIGGTGAGKSSLLRILATEESPSSGSISLFGYGLNAISPFTLRAIRQSVGYVPQDVRLIPDLSVAENVALSLSLAGRRALSSTSGNRIDELLHILGLSAKRDRPAGALSGGEAQRVAIARALVRSPELLIADEPTGAQDQDFTWLIMDLFLKANLSGTTVIIATHDRELVRRVRKPCALLKAGRLYMEDPLARGVTGGSITGVQR